MDNKLRFDWDPDKASMNLNKHDVSFEEAQTVFMDERAILFDDPDHSLEEERFLILGISQKLRLLIVSHCIRESGDVIRLISARKATTREAKQYEESNY
ncbi:MAG: BrnT family toxin [Spirochaetales bacterium]|nr:BrnT family toxin [Spirochaetales bacterium]